MFKNEILTISSLLLLPVDRKNVFAALTFRVYRAEKDSEKSQKIYQVLLGKVVLVVKICPFSLKFCISFFILQERLIKCQAERDDAEQRCKRLMQSIASAAEVRSFYSSSLDSINDNRVINHMWPITDNSASNAIDQLELQALPNTGKHTSAKSCQCFCR